MKTQSKLVQQLMAVAPIRTFMMGDRADKSTWQIEFADSATQAHRDAAATVIAAFDWTTTHAAFQGRIDALANDSEINDIMDRLDNATLTQINAWLVNKLPQADAGTRAMFAVILKYLARLRP